MKLIWHVLQNAKFERNDYEKKKGKKTILHLWTENNLSRKLKILHSFILSVLGFFFEFFIKPKNMYIR